jgi:hypothetical protein
MKKNKKGFALTGLLLIIAILAIGGGAYYYYNKSSKPKDITGQNEKDISDEQVIAALNADLVSSQSYPDTYKTNSKYQYKLQKDSQGKEFYGVTVQENTSIATNTVLGIYKGDLNGDTYADALVWVNSCTNSDCGYGLRIVLNKKDGMGASIKFTQPDTISGWSGGDETRLDVVEIDQGVIYITSSTFKDSGDYKVAKNLPKQTKKFKLQGDKLIEVK